MASLLDLPTETLQQIISDVIPNDFDALRLSCKSIKAACDHFVPRHREWVRQYRTWSPRLAPDPSRYGEFPAISLLREIVKHPVIARYVQTLDLRAPAFEDETPSSSPDLDQEEMNQLEKLISQSNFLLGVDGDSRKWLSYLSSEESDERTSFCNVFLLSLLPNLQSLGLSPEWSTSETVTELSDIVGALVDQANSGPQDHDVGLSKLTRLTPFSDFGYECRMPLYLMEPFLALRSLKEFYGASLIALEDGYTGISFEPTGPDLGNNLTTLELHDCVFGRHEMARLLANMHQLQKLCISLTTKWHGCGFNCNAGGIVGSICESPAANTLTHLSLLCVSPWNECFTGVDSLRDLRVLESLAIDTAFFHGPPYSKHKDFDEQNEMYGENKDDRSQATPRLDHLLPKSLRKLDLLIGNPQEHTEVLDGMFKGLDLDALKGAVPLLDKVVAHAFRNAYDEWGKSVEPWPAIYSAMLAVDVKWKFVSQNHSMESRDLVDFTGRFDVESL